MVVEEFEVGFETGVDFSSSLGLEVQLGRSVVVASLHVLLHSVVFVVGLELGYSGRRDRLTRAR